MNTDENQSKDRPSGQPQEREGGCFRNAGRLLRRQEPACCGWRQGAVRLHAQESYPDKGGGKKYSNLFFPITNAAKMDLQDAVLKAYDQHLNQQHDTGQYDHWDGHNDGMMPFGM